VYNINHGHNREILKRSKTLDSYSVFVDKVREHQKADLTLAESIKNAIKYCIDHNILKVFLETHSSEVFNMLTDEWNWDEYMEVAIEEAREKGLELGIKEGTEKGIKKGIEQGIERGIEQTARNLLAIGITFDDIVRATGLPIEKVRVLASEGVHG
jgi:predicted transposase/invertase (TIGR01784 family)